MTQFLLIATLTGLCQLELPDSRDGLIISAALIALIHCLSTLSLLKAKFGSPHTIKKNILNFVFFIMGSGVMLLVLIRHHDSLLGYVIYFVPSESMQPTLEPADLILVNSRQRDGWLHNQIIVFSAAENSDYFYVKRIASKPEHLKNSANDLYFVMGDNRNHSTDSRVLGLIQQQYIQGEAKLVLLNLADPGRHLLALP